MIVERTYRLLDLHHGKCEWCGEVSDELTEENVCVDCIESELFYQETMKGLK